MKVSVVLWLSTLQFFQIEGVEDIFYNHNNVRCEKCEKGQKVKVHCNRDWQKSECVACEEGTFADRYSSSTLCEICADCSHTDQIIKNNCTSEKNTECACPDKKYYNLDFCMTCEPPKIKRVRDKKEYCEDCEYGSYYNNTVEDCVKCDICTRDQVTLHICNVTHNTQCKQAITSPSSSTTTQVLLTAKYEEGLSVSEITGIVITVIIILVIFVVVCVVAVLRRKKKYCFRDRSNREIDKEAETPLKSDNQSETQPSQPSRESSRMINMASPISSETQQSPSPPESRILSSKSEWVNKLCTLLINDMSHLDILVANLGTREFNARAKWDQLDGINIERRFLKVMNMWYEQTNQPTLETIISALTDMKRNDIVELIRNDVILKEQLIKENVLTRIQNDKHDVPCDKIRNGIDKLKRPIQATDDGQSYKVISANSIDSVDNQHSLVAAELNITLTNDNLPDPHQTQPKTISGSDLDEEQTDPKQLLPG